MSQIKLKHSGGNSVIIAAPSSNPSSDVTLKLPQSDGSANEFLKTDGSGNLSFSAVSAGITMVDTWRLITQYINAQGTLGGTSDWERDDTYGNGLLGTGMTQASGYFTFPSTGFYSVKFYGHHSMSYSNGRSITGQLIYTPDNFSSTEFAAYYTVNCTGDSGTVIHGSGSLEKIFDITDTSNQKVKFAVGVAQNGSAMRTTVDTNTNRTYAIFTRLGDT